MKNLILLLTPLILCSCLQVYSCGEIEGSISYFCIPEDRLVLDSTGGLIYEALEIAELTIETHVKYVCNSACVLISAAGEFRTACHFSSFGLHSGTGRMGNIKMLEFYKADDRILGDEVASIIINTPYESLYTFSAYEAKRLGLIDEVKTCTPAGDYI